MISPASASAVVSDGVKTNKTCRLKKTENREDRLYLRRPPGGPLVPLFAL